jgi:aryl-alcohol dehydrogenase-like predicted oxidoreductase
MKSSNTKTKPITKIHTKTKRLGNSDLSITPVGFGAWAIGGSGWQFAWGPQDDRESIAAIHRALELGVNWIDTAAVYGLGHSEEVVARALAEWAWCSAHVFTKCGLRSVGSGKVYEVLKTDSILRECEDSLRRLGVEAIDLYQIHWPVETSLCPGISWRRRPARPHRPFEKLCWSLSSQADEQESIRLIRSAIDGGITFMDNCWDYNGGASEIRMGKALRDGYRDKVFLITKIDGRTKESAAPQIDGPCNGCRPIATTERRTIHSGWAEAANRRTSLLAANATREFASRSSGQITEGWLNDSDRPKFSSRTGPALVRDVYGDIIGYRNK